jgi:transposase
MADEELRMTTRDRDRLKVLHGVRKKHISQVEAARELGVTPRWIRQLVRRLRKEGDRGVVHRGRGRRSNRKLSAKLRRRVMEIVRRKQEQRQWHDYGPTLMAEELEDGHGIRVGKETLRQWLIEEKLWRARPRRVETVHTWRARREREGELVQWDTSEHDWLEGRGPKLYLIAMIDDATSRALARFVYSDSTEENLEMLRRWLERQGRPLAFYTDKARLFANVPKRQDGAARTLEQMPPTQIGRALRDLNIDWIAAHSPQAKGRVERFFGTAQNRLVKGLRRARARTLDQANAYLEQVYLPLWNDRFTVAPAQVHDAHRPLEAAHELASILSHVEPRAVANDYTIRFRSRVYQILRENVRPGLRGATVDAEYRKDGSVWVRFQGRILPTQLCPTRPPPEPKRRSRTAAPTDPEELQRQRNQWMREFLQKPAPPLWKALRNSNAHA